MSWPWTVGLRTFITLTGAPPILQKISQIGIVFENFILYFYSNIHFCLLAILPLPPHSSKDNWIEGGGDKVSVHFAVTFLDCWRTSFCVTTIIMIVNNNINDKQTSSASLALDEDSPYTNSCLFTLDRLPLLLLLRKN